MSQTETEPKPEATVPPKRRRKKWRWIFLFLLICLVVFHRPLIRTTLHFAAVKLLATQHLKLQFAISGNFFSTLVLKNLRIDSADDKNTTPIEHLDAQKISLHYSLISLAKHGLPGLVQNCEVDNVHLRIQQTPPSGPPPTVNEIIHTILQIPPLLGKKIVAKDVNILVHLDNGDFLLNGVSLLLYPNRAGSLTITRLKIPGGPDWRDIRGTTKFANRDLIINNLKIAPQIRIDHFEYPIPHKTGEKEKQSESVNHITLRGKLIKTDVSLSLKFDPAHLQQTKLNLDVKNISLTAIHNYFHTNPKMSGEIPEFSVAFNGDFNQPKTWNIESNINANALTVSDFRIEPSHAKLTVLNGNLKVAPFEIRSGDNRLTLSAQCELPAKLDDFPSAQIDSNYQIDAPKLQQISPKIRGGSLHVKGHVTLANRELKTELNGTASAIESDEIALDSASFQLSALQKFSQKPATPPASPTSLLETLNATLTANFQKMRMNRGALDSGTFRAKLANGHLAIDKGNVVRGDNRITFHAKADLPDDFAKWKQSAFEVHFALDAPNLAQFQAKQDFKDANGKLEIHADILHSAKGFSGNITAQGHDFTLAKFTAQKLDAKIAIVRNVASIQNCDLVINKENAIHANGEVHLDSPFSYSGKSKIALENLSVFNPLLKFFGAKPALAGTVHLDWAGNGNFAKPANRELSGTINFTAKKIRYEKITVSEAALTGHYTPKAAKFSKFHIASHDVDLKMLIEVRDGKLRLYDIQLSQKKIPVLTGYVFLPFDIQNPTKLISPKQSIAANLNVAKLDIQKLLASLNIKSPVGGTLSANLILNGTLFDPDGKLRINGKSITLKSKPKLGPTDFDANINYKNKTLSVDSTIKQHNLKPLTIHGNIPLDVKVVVENKKLNPNTPLNFSIDLPRSSIAFVSKLVPALRYIEGAAEIHSKISGTLQNPKLSGSVLLDLPALRLRQPTAPSVSHFKADLRFTNHHLEFQKFAGDISGGTFQISGGLDFKTLLAPDFNLHIQAKNALALRNDTLTVRVDTDLRITGPLKSAKVTGSIDLTKSRFFRDIDILPIQLPSQPAPKLPETSEPISIDIPPFRNWTFDVAIRTKKGDPFLIRSNLATGHAIVNLRLIGTGLNPALKGEVRVEHFVASLPFSRLNVTIGHIYFSPSDPFVPTLDIYGVSNMRNYNISVYIYGNASNPKTVFSSEPPLPQEDIISLLATGATPDELTGSGNVLAGRAAALLFNKIYHTVFKNKKPPKQGSFQDRFQVNVGAVDSRTGRQEIDTQFQLNKHFYLVGDLDVQGDVTGQLKYLIRFR